MLASLPKCGVKYVLMGRDDGSIFGSPYSNYWGSPVGSVVKIPPG